MNVVRCECRQLASSVSVSRLLGERERATVTENGVVGASGPAVWLIGPGVVFDWTGSRSVMHSWDRPRLLSALSLRLVPEEERCESDERDAGRRENAERRVCPGRPGKNATDNDGADEPAEGTQSEHHTHDGAH